MASNINPAYPAAGAASTGNVRNNFSAAKSEIEALQADMPAPVSSAEVAAGTGTTPRTWSPADVTEAIENFSSGVDPTPSISPLFSDGSLSASALVDGGIALTVAHFDDEILWLLPALYLAKSCDVTAHPLSDKHYYGIARLPSWYNLRLRIPVGNAIEDSFLNIWADQTVRLDYMQREHFRNRIRDFVRTTPAHNIFTHNPWGEYGHVHHRIVHEETVAACVEFGKSCWFSGIYVNATPEGNVGGASPDDYVNESLLLPWVEGNWITGDFLPLRQSFVDSDAAFDAAYPSSSLPNTWTWYQGDGHPGGTEVSKLYVYHRIIADGVRDTSADGEIDALKASLPTFGCTDDDCTGYYP
jgi:hypothetical protein